MTKSVKLNSISGLYLHTSCQEQSNMFSDASLQHCIWAFSNYTHKPQGAVVEVVVVGLLYYSWIHTVVTWNTSDATASWNVTSIRPDVFKISPKSFSSSQNKLSYLLLIGPERNGVMCWVHCLLVSCGTNYMQASSPSGQWMLVYSCLSQSCCCSNAMWLFLPNSE